jgi:hypothetical protein
MASCDRRHSFLSKTSRARRLAVYKYWDVPGAQQNVKQFSVSLQKQMTLCPNEKILIIALMEQNVW